MSEELIKPCMTCKEQPVYKEIANMYYLKCLNCEKIEVAIAKKTVIENWNFNNTRKENLKKKELAKYVED